MNKQKEQRPQNEPNEFERRLTAALRSVDPSDGFTGRVMSQVAIDTRIPGRSGPRFAWPWRSAFAMATVALLVLAASIAYGLHARRQRAQVAQIQSQFETAIAVTSRTLDHAQIQLDRARVWEHISSASHGISEK
jgi:hypothetical protein